MLFRSQIESHDCIRVAVYSGKVSIGVRQPPVNGSRGIGVNEVSSSGISSASISMLPDCLALGRIDTGSSCLLKDRNVTVSWIAQNPNGASVWTQHPICDANNPLRAGLPVLSFDSNVPTFDGWQVNDHVQGAVMKCGLIE